MALNPARTGAVEQRRQYHAPLSSGALPALAFAGLALLSWTLATGRWGAGQRDLMAVACTVVFSAVTLLALAKLVTIGVGTLTIGPNGLRDLRVSRRAVPWHAIERIVSRVAHREIALTLRDAELAAALRRRHMFRVPQSGPPGEIRINTSGALGLTHAELLSQIVGRMVESGAEFELSRRADEILV